MALDKETTQQIVNELYEKQKAEMKAAYARWGKHTVFGVLGLIIGAVAGYLFALATVGV